MKDPLKRVDHLKELLAQNKIEFVITKIKTININLPDWIGDELILVEGRFNEYKKNKNLGLLSTEEDSVSQSKIRASILYILNKIMLFLGEQHLSDLGVKKQGFLQNKDSVYIRKFQTASSINELEDLIKDVSSGGLDARDGEKIIFLLTESLKYLSNDDSFYGFGSNKERRLIRNVIIFRTFGLLGVVSLSTFIFILSGYLILAIVIGILLGIFISQISNE